MNTTQYITLANLFRYPSEQSSAHVKKCSQLINEEFPELISMLRPFQKHCVDKTLAELQEYYIKTFDVTAVCFLDIGYVLFGEDYKRGDFLVFMKQEQAKAQNDCGVELPDHLPNVLTLIPKLDNPSLAEELVISLTIPALKEMISQFKNTGNVYCQLLEMLVGILQKEYAGSNYPVFQIHSENDNGFLKNYSCGVDQSLFERKNTKTKTF